ncbi:hypothetical protein WBV44_17575 [Acinetobacter baumannii]|uniref:SLOG domain-containing protein n=1 Tax=Acinetobacter calcoaceticus/baumannii complex TaxID=909768 RepID=UPI0018DD9C90|nr:MULTISPECIES: hypothetical protein [Acinetobacter calcoaceticus/baumannii complex]MDH2546100.1 hypothetical protein [Acinetobacter baumannii]MDO7209458.1 hypothetical protein [Acinetobacter nosocomialis]MDO7231455.1 hypothetical protein [Acinetobacter nosocomialis]MDO7435679.1 hypothetical protein [Acinetobacter nosocomialis]MDV7449451.1 hypothetical protein [Acinetobacter baumannii]
MLNIFLSASIPLSDRKKCFYETADVLAIKEAIRSLVEVVIPNGRIVCGGHPAITPLLAMATKNSKKDRNFISIYQSNIFKPDFPKSVYDFIDLTLIDGNPEEREESLNVMRQAMIQSQKFDAIVLIGGMEGVIEELEIFLEYHPHAKVIPLASTGAAAKIVYDNEYNKLKPRFQLDPRFENDYTYSSLFRRIFNKDLNH